MTILHDLSAIVSDAGSGALAHVGYGAVAAFMALESTFVPVPAELMMIPAGIESARGHLAWPLVLAVALLAGLVGSTFNYALGRVIRVESVHRALRWVGVRQEKYVAVENALLANAKLVLFIGRFVPGVRHLVAIPAGIWKVPLATFYAATLAGDLLYVPLFFAAGYFSGGRPDGRLLAAVTLATLVTSGAGLWAARGRFAAAAAPKK